MGFVLDSGKVGRHMGSMHGKSFFSRFGIVFNIVEDVLGEKRECSVIRMFSEVLDF